MVDVADVRWLLIAVASVSAVVVVIGLLGNRLEQRYALELRPPSDEPEQEPDELPVRYHAQVLAQAWVSYYVCLFFTGLAFVLLVASDESRGLLVALVTVILAAIYFVESRKSRASMLEQARALRAEDDDRRREEERMRLIALVSDGDARDRLVRELVLRLDHATGDAQPASPQPVPSYVTPE